MPRPAKGIRLWLRPAEVEPDRVRPATWLIRDGAKAIRTGCGAGDREAAEQRLAAYIAARYAVPRRQRSLSEIGVADVITVYLQDVARERTNPAGYAKRAERLLGFWGLKSLAEVTGANCRAYAASRGNEGGARRDLQDLSAAIQHHHREGYHLETVRVWLPRKGERRERWLTRGELARLVLAAWRMRERQRRERDNENAPPRPTERRTGRHLARGILFAYYTGSRPGDALRASWHAGAERSYIDMDAGVFYRRPIGKRATTKRQPPVRLGERIMAHLRRWRERKLCASYVVEWEGKPVLSVKTAFARAAAEAGLGAGVSPHTLRHSRVTHMLQAGVPLRDAAEAVGMTEAIAREVYGHHHPEHLRRAVNAR